MEKVCQFIDRLVALAIENSLIDAMDEIYARNRLMAHLGVVEYEAQEITLEASLYEVLDNLAAFAIEAGKIEDTLADRDNFTSMLMNVFMDKPSVVNANFWAKYQENPALATSYFYEMSRMVNYVKVDRIAKNQAFTTASPYGDMQITINLSKPEKDPKEIERMKTAPPNKYPSCLLCKENEGYQGTITLPDRANHRMIRLSLQDKPWLLQYSPYLYYNEHCIVLSPEHKPMQITRATFQTLLDFTAQFPHYFIGSNADLPIVGGSILSHEHYQGGSHTFPLDHAQALFEFGMEAYPMIRGSVLNWPLSTIELRSTDQSKLTECSTMILELWKNYSDEAQDIIASTGEVKHNTVTPICKRDGEDFVMRLVLRNNRTTEEHPLGIFHPHAEVHHIKKENIGLIEVMGLAILPGRLLTEIEEIKAYIKGEGTEVPAYHLEWAQELKANYNLQDVDLYVKQAIGDKFTTVLENAGVYKLTPHGLEGFKAFIAQFATLNPTV